jgi:hypothetical protein
MKKKVTMILAVMFSMNLSTSVYANSANEEAQAAKILSLEQRLAKLEQEQEKMPKAVAQSKTTEESKVSFSGMFSTRYRNVDYRKTGTASSVTNQYRIRLDGKVQVNSDSFVGFRFVTKAPNKNNLFNDSWINSGGDNQVTANGTNNTYNNLIDRYYYTTKLGSNTVLTLGEQALVIDPMNVIVDSTFYSYGGARVSSKLDKDTTVTAQYGSFYRGVTLKGFKGWGSKSATDFNNADIASVIISSKLNEVNYQLGYANFRNNDVGKNLLSYTFANVGFLVTPKVGLSFEVADNSADNDGRFGTAKVVYGDQVLKKKGQWNVSFQYLDAQKNAIFNRYAMIEGGVGSNTNDPQRITDARINYAFSTSTTFYIQRMTINDKVAADNTNDNVLWKAELDVKF